MTEHNHNSEAVAPIQKQIEDLAEQVEDLPPLPTAEEAEFGELHRRGQFDQCELVDDEAGGLIEFITEGDDSDKVAGGVEDHWDRIGEAPCKGWIWMTPAGAIPLQPMKGDEVLQFLEEMTKPWPKDDPRRGSEQ